MSDSFSQQQERTRKIIADAKRLIDEANAALDASERFFADNGLDRERVNRLVRQLGGPDAEREIQERVQRAMQEFEQRAEQEALHQRFTTHASMRTRRVRNLV